VRRTPLVRQKLGGVTCSRPKCMLGKCRSKSQPHVAKLKKVAGAIEFPRLTLMKGLICALPGGFAGTRYGAASRYSDQFSWA